MSEPPSVTAKTTAQEACHGVRALVSMPSGYRPQGEKAGQWQRPPLSTVDDIRMCWSGAFSLK